MKNYVLLAFLFTILISFAGCYADMVDFEPYEPDPPIIGQDGNIDRFFDQIPDYSVTKILNPEEGHLIVTENETLIELPANLFQSSDGSIATEEIEFKYYEILEPAKYLFHQLPTISNGTILRTEGVFRFEATRDGEPLKLTEGKSIRVRLPDDTPEQGMMLFYGEGEGPNFNWERANVSTGTDNDIFISEWGEQVDSFNNLITGYGYEFNCDLFKWINVDIFTDIPDDEKTDVCVELPEIYNDDNTIVFMLFNDIKSILALRPVQEKMQFCEPYSATPIGYKVTFIVISHIDENEFHFGLQMSEIKENHVEFIEPEEKSLEEILEIIEGL